MEKDEIKTAEAAAVAEAASSVPGLATIVAIGLQTPDTFGHHEPPFHDATPAPKTLKTKNPIRIKAERARPRIMLLIACLAYLITALVAISIGLRNVSGFVDARLESAHSEFQAQTSDMHREKIIYSRLDNLLSSQLSRGYMESHEQCLARGLWTANHLLFGLGFQYPDIRDYTMDWTEDNCGRLFYAPQVVEPTPQHAVLDFWAQTSYRSRQLAEEALSFIKQRYNWIWDRLFSTDRAQDGATHIDHVYAHNYLQQHSFRDQRSRTPMPFGFALHCEKSRACRLVYPPTPGKPADKEVISAEAIAKTGRKVADLTSFAAKLTTLRHTIAVSINTSLALQCFFIMIHTIATIYTLESTLPHAVAAAASERPQSTIDTLMAPWSKEDKYAVGSILLELATMLARAVTDKRPNNGGDPTMIAGLVVSLLGLSMLISFSVPTSKLEDVMRIYDLSKELCLIVRGRDITSPANNGSDRKGSTEGMVDKNLLQDEKEGASTEASQTSQPSNKPSRHLVSLTTTLQADIQTELQALREENGSRAISESDFDVETESDTDTESESESENESFVDLAGGVTPTITEVESDWSVVDA